MSEPETRPLILGALAFAVFLIAFAAGADRKAKRNRRTGLPAPKPDPRGSIEQFRRMHQP